MLNNRPREIIFKEFYNDRTYIFHFGTLAYNLLVSVKQFYELSDLLKINYGVIIEKNISSEKKYNIILIQIESLDSSIIHKEYNGTLIMPFLSKLSKESVFYPYVLSYTSVGFTADTELSIIDGIEPFRNIAVKNIKNYDYPNSIIKQFSKSNYAIYSFHGNSGSFYNRKNVFKNYGFEYFFSIEDMNLKEFGWGAKDEEVFDFVLAKLKTQKDKFLYYIITMSSHSPYTNVLYYYKNSSYNSIENENLRNYYNSMSYVDQALKKFIESISSLEDTYIFIYGDHPCDLKNICSKIDINKTIFKFVPLIIITPDKQVYVEDKKIATFLDFGITILYSSNIPFSIYSSGVNLLDYPIKNNFFLKNGVLYQRTSIFEIINNSNKR